MKSFIAFTFIMLFGGFYVMSGGPDFVPNEVSPFAEGREVPVIPSNSGSQIETAQVSPQTPEQAPVVAKSQIILTSSPLALPADGSVDQKKFSGDVVATLVTDTQKAVALTAPQIGATPEATLSLASLSTAGDAPVAKSALDLRNVVASRVNMRNGPGTRFDVISTLDRNEQVEVLRVGDNGWVRLKTASGRVGWMAERLLSEKAN